MPGASTDADMGEDSSASEYGGGCQHEMMHPMSVEAKSAKGVIVRGTSAFSKFAGKITTMRSMLI